MPPSTTLQIVIQATDKDAAAKIETLRKAGADLGVAFRQVNSTLKDTDASAQRTARSIHVLTEAEAEARVAAQAHNAAFLQQARVHLGIQQSSRALSSDLKRALDEVKRNTLATVEQTAAAAGLEGRLGGVIGSIGALTSAEVLASPVMIGLTAGAVALAGGLAAVGASAAVARKGLEMAGLLEQARMGIAGELVANADFAKAGGGKMSDEEKFAAGLAIADEQLKKMQGDAAQTGVDVTALVEGFNLTGASALRANITFDQLRTDLVQMLALSRAWNIPYQQVNQTLLQILNGHTTARNKIAAILDIQPKELALAKQQGTIQDLLNSKLAKYNVEIQASTETAGALDARLKSAAASLSATTVGPLHEEIKSIQTDLVGAMFDKSTGQFGGAIKGLVTTLREAFQGAGTLMGDAMRQGIEGAKELSSWLDRHRETVEHVGRAFVSVARSVGGILVDVGGIVGDVVTWLTDLGVIDTLADTLKFVFGIAAGIVSDIKSDIESIANIVKSSAFQKALISLIAVTNPAMALALSAGQVATKTPTAATAGTLAPLVVNAEAPPKVTPHPEPGESKGDKGAGALAEAQLHDIAEKTKIDEESIREQYQQSLLSIDDYYRRLTAIEYNGLQSQIEVENKRLEAKNLEPEQRAAILQRIATLEDEQLALGKKNDAEALKAKTELAAKVEGLTAASLRAQGRELDASLVEIQQRYGELLKRLQVEGNAGGKAIVEGLISSETMKARLDDIERQATAVKERLSTETALTKAQVDTGAIQKDAGAKQLAASYAEARKELQRLVDLAKALAEATGDPKAVEAANRLALALANVDLEGAKAAKTTSSIGKDLAAGFSKAFESIGNAMAHAKTGADALKAVTGAILGDITRFALKGIDQSASGFIQRMFAGKGGAPTVPQTSGLEGLTTSIVAPGVGGGAPSANLAAAGATITTGATELQTAAAATQAAGASISAGAAALQAAAGAMAAASASKAAASAADLSLAGGGPVWGAGSGTSDSIPAMLSHGEYVTRAASVAKLGRPAMDHINRTGTLPIARLAAGGLIMAAGGGAIASPARGPVGPSVVQLNARVEKGIILEVLGSTEAQKVQLRTVGQNAKAYQSALRIPGSQG